MKLKHRVASYPSRYFRNPGAKSRAEAYGLTDVENDDLTAEGLKAKMVEWDEVEHGVPARIYRMTEKQLRSMGERMPPGIRKASRRDKMNRQAVAKELVAVARELVAAEGDKCGPKGCIRKVKDGWGVMSGKTGKMWPQTYKSKEDAEDALKRYHGWGFNK